jgi:hypothetical protein
MDTTDLLHSILAKDYVSSSEQFNTLVREKIDSRIQDMKFQLAQTVFNSAVSPKTNDNARES